MHERFAIRFTLMGVSTAGALRQHIEGLQDRTFVTVSELVASNGGASRAVEVAISRLAQSGSLAQIRKGLYWKGPQGPHGMLPPTPIELGVAIGGPGSGPSDVSAARFLGLTTQVPVMTHVAVPGRAPTQVPGIGFHARPYSRSSHALKPAEVAVLEVLRIWPSGVEVDWEVLRDRVAELKARGFIRPPVLTAALADERTPAVRQLWHLLRAEIVITG